MFLRPHSEHLVREALSDEIDAFEIEHDFSKLLETTDEAFRLRPADELGAVRKEPDDRTGLAELEVLRDFREYLGEVVVGVGVELLIDKFT